MMLLFNRILAVPYAHQMCGFGLHLVFRLLVLMTTMGLIQVLPVLSPNHGLVGSSND